MILSLQIMSSTKIFFIFVFIFISLRFISSLDWWFKGTNKKGHIANNINLKTTAWRTFQWIQSIESITHFQIIED